MITIPIIFVLWIYSDTITEFLCKGKPFANNELKGFR